MTQSQPKPQPWIVLGTELAYDGRTKVRQDRLRLPDGREADWEILVQGNTVATVAMTPGADSVVVFEQFRPGPGKELVELPGGGIEDGEDPLAAGLRELLEETGYRAQATFLAEPEWAASNSARRRYLVVAAGCWAAAEPSWDEWEFGNIRELPIGEFFALLLSGELTDAGLAMRGLFAFARAEPSEPALLVARDRIRELLRSF